MENFNDFRAKDDTEKITLLNTYNKDAKEGDVFYEDGKAFAVYNGAEWVKNQPITLTDLEDVDITGLMDSSIPLEEDQILMYDASHPVLTLEVQDYTGLKAGEGLRIEKVEPPTTFCIYNPDGDLMVNIDIVTGNVEFGETYDLDEAAEIFWTGVAMMSPWIEPPHTQDNEELEKQYAAMDASFGDEELTDWPMEYKQEFSSIEDDVEVTVDPFEAARGVIE